MHEQTKRRESLDTVLASFSGLLRPLSALAGTATGRTGLPTGHAQLDRELGGGLQRGVVSEFSGKVGTLGLTGLQHSILLAARQAQIFTVLIDAFDRFDVESCPLELRSSLLWVRGNGRVSQALKATDLLARDPNFSLLLLDLREAETRDLRRVPAPQWYRLQRAVRESDALLLAFTPFPTVVSATTRIRFQQPAGIRSPSSAIQWTILRNPNHLGAAAM